MDSSARYPLCSHELANEDKEELRRHDRPPSRKTYEKWESPGEKQKGCQCPQLVEEARRSMSY